MTLTKAFEKIGDLSILESNLLYCTKSLKTKAYLNILNFKHLETLQYEEDFYYVFDKDEDLTLAIDLYEKRNNKKI